MKICKTKGCNNDISNRWKSAQYCIKCAKQRSREYHRGFYRAHRKKILAERKNDEYRKNYNNRIRERYAADPEFRKYKMEMNRRYRKKIKGMNKLGDKKTIKKICKDFGIGDDVADAIALDGDVLDNMMRKRGLLKSNIV